jgi:cell division initiation protein
MLTPQDIQEQEFAKAVFGGYDMTAVDNFLEEVTESYTALYKENAVLKGKLKVLVEKVEEYRSTEDAMRMALLTAQKMSDDMTAEAKEKCDKMLSDTQDQAAQSRTLLARELADENTRLEAAKAKTAAFVSASRQIIDQYEDFLDRLNSVTQEYGGVTIDTENEPARSPEPEPSGVAARNSYVAKARANAASDADADEAETVQEIDSVVADIMGEDMSAETKRIDTGAVNAAISQDDEVDEPTRKFEWTKEDEETTPRPKFDFSDLKFGANYDDKK